MSHAAPTIEAAVSSAAPKSRAPMPAAKPPVGVGPVPFVGAVLALVLVAVGLAGIRDALVAIGAVEGEPWIDSVVDTVDGWQPQFWLVPAGIALVLLGVWLILVALRPRSRTGVAVRAATGVFLRTGDVERLAARAASDVDGVLSARSSASHRKVEVRVAVTGGANTADRVRTAVQDALQPLESIPTVQVKTAGAGGGS